jgi:hypothetical protein
VLLVSFVDNSFLEIMKEGRVETHKTADVLTPGKSYECLLNGTPLYEARIHNVMGCWATVEVVRSLPGPHEHNYKPGQTFDIRVSSYTFDKEV